MLKGYTSTTELVDRFIDNKVEEMLEQSIVENRKRRKLEHKISDVFPESKADDIALINSTYELMNFPIYNGTGEREHAPDIQGSLENEGKISQTLWYRAVPLEEKEEYVRVLVSDGFEGQNNEYAMVKNDKKYYINIEYSNRQKQMRLYHTITKA